MKKGRTHAAMQFLHQWMVYVTGPAVPVFAYIRIFFLIFVLVRLPFGTIKIEMKYQKTKNNIKNKRKKKDDVSQLHW